MSCRHDITHPGNTMVFDRFSSERDALIYRCVVCRGTAEVCLYEIPEHERKKLHKATKPKRRNRFIEWLKRTFQGPIGPPGMTGATGPDGKLAPEDREVIQKLVATAESLHNRLVSLELKVRGVVDR